MQSKGAIKLVAVLLALACVFQLSFSFKTRSVEKAAEKYAAGYEVEVRDSMVRHYLDSLENQPVYNLGFQAYTYKECKEKEINLGLDLKGGMNVMLEVQVGDVVKALAGESQNDPAFEAAIAAAKEAEKSGEGDFIGAFVKAFKANSNGASLASIFVSPDRKDINPNSTDSEVEKILRQETSDAIDASFNVLRSRIDHFGVTQPNIQRLPNSNRILVELPGVKEPERVRKLLQGTASLEFWTTYNGVELHPALARADELIRQLNSEEEQAAEIVESEETAAETPATDLVEEVAKATEVTEEEVAAAATIDPKRNPLLALLNPQFAGGAVIGAAYAADMPAVDRYLAMPQVRELFPADVQFKWAVKGDPQMDGRFALYTIKVESADGKAPLDGSVVVDARESYAERGAEARVSMNMNSEGMQEWARLTGENVNRCIAIVLDGYVYSAPVVRGKIEGSSEISGNFTIQEAKDLANVLKSGKVPAPARIIQDTVVGPSLGQESINAGLLSFAIAFLLVLLYMGLFYKSAGWVADFALLTNVFLLMGFLVSFGAVLTLPGIAGIVLTMGMAVDANVIIYERIKEELRGGKGLGSAIKDGFSNAYSAIIDGNLTTIITGIVLFIFGTGPVQGFATTLIIGIITSLFCSIFITRLVLEWIVGKWGSISFSRKWSENFLANVKFDFVGKRKISYIVSGTVIVLSLVSFAVRGLNLGTEFTGGRAYTIRFDKPVQAEDVRAALDGAFVDGDAASVSCEVKQYGSENQMRIVTQYKFDDTSEETTAEVDEIIYNALKPLYSYDISFDSFRFTQDDQNGIISADKIGPSIAKDMTWNAIYSVLFSLLAIGLYIAFRFKKWQWATGATLALAHNSIVVIGLFSIFYGLMPFALEVNQAFIAAILTLIGYSINDTVVIFDRIREYITLYPKRNFRDNINNAICSTLSRTINTSGTTLVTLLAIFLFGGETIRGFIFALLVGVIVGTYSSVFVATPIAYDLMSKKETDGKE
ncbi:protein translocase subunit SecDF [uncultured Alistipes sp.]|uniref:protein translocase subunit SecDF n=1 Tax=uncultured Alistipes sp. TaxID=538949 RepID=UPI0025E74F8E|nr:protein translocase subunit SecDF [uncultured Alistipes sp.]